MAIQQAVQQIAVELIDRSKTNPTSRSTNLGDLAASIKAAGILVPLQVFKVGKRFELDDGEGRWTVAKELGFRTVPCMVIAKPASSALHQLIKGTTGRNLSPWEQAQLVGRCLADKIKQKEIAEAVGRSEGWVSRFKTIWEASKKAVTRDNGSGGFNPWAGSLPFDAYTNADELYEECQAILHPKAAEKKAAKKAAAEAGDGDKQADLVDAVQKKELEELETCVAETFALPVDQVKAEIDGAGALHLVLRFSSLQAAAKAMSLPF